jgi:hypothetical protein
MEPITVTTQEEYDTVLAAVKKNPPKPCFDIEAGIGIPIIKDVNTKSLHKRDSTLWDR